MAIKADYKDAADRPLHPPERLRLGRWLFLLALVIGAPLAFYLGTDESDSGDGAAPTRQPTPDRLAQPKPALDAPEEPDPGALAPVLVRQAPKPPPAPPEAESKAAEDSRSSPAPANTKSADTKAKPPSPADAEQHTTGPQPRRFEFYRLLREYEVEVPPPPKPRPEAPAARVSDPTTDPRELAREKRLAERPREGIYALQAGSFRTREQAETLRAELALLGLEAAISDTRAADGRNWFRVRVGPYRDADERDAVIENLEGNGIKPILVRMK
ncbi:MAG: SPOR domain-containing protein [Gammaproteobacteria bacterium]